MNLSFSHDDELGDQREEIIRTWEKETIAIARKKLLKCLDPSYIISKRKRKLYPLNQIAKVTEALIVNTLMNFEKKYCYSKNKKEPGPCIFSISNTDFMILVSPMSKEMLDDGYWLTST